MNQPRRLLDTAQITQTTITDLSTTVRALRTDTTVLPQAEVDTPSGTNEHGLDAFGTPGVQRANKRFILESLEAEADRDTVLTQPNLFLPQIGFEEVMENLAEKIVRRSGGSPVDVVFVLDASGSMGDNLRAVARHLIDMADVYKISKIDYVLGLTDFWAYDKPPTNKIRVRQLTKNIRDYQQEIRQLIPRKDENALDAIDQTVREMRFRPTSKKHLILVTDEPLSSIKEISLGDAIAMCREFDIHVNVLGTDTEEHKRLAEETGGSWHAIPEDSPDLAPQSRHALSRNPRYKTRVLNNARWRDVTEIGKVSLKELVNNTLDVILFIDGSKSMEDKLPEFLKQLEGIVRDWDNALIDYQIGVVRFRTGTGTLNFVNVFQPPQTMDDLRQIVSLPCQGNEQLLDAIVEGMRRLKLRPGAQPYLILLTDEPSAGQHSPQAVIQLCQEAGAKVSVVGTFDSFQQEVATETNGVWVPIPGGKATSSLNW